MHSLYVAWQYLRFHKVKAVVLVAALTLITFLPLAVHILVRASEVQMLDRSRATPLGPRAKGQRPGPGDEHVVFRRQAARDPRHAGGRPH